MKRWKLLSITIAVSIVIWPAWVARGAISLRVGLADSGNSVRRVAALAFRQLVVHAASSRMHVSIAGPALWGHSGASELELVRAVMAGDPPLALVNSATLSNFSADFDVLDAPYLFVNREHVVRVLYGPAGRAMLDSLEPRGLLGLAFVGDRFRVLLSRNRLTVPPRLSGMRMGTVQSASGELFVESLGGEAVPAPITRMLGMAHDGFIDGADLDPCSAASGQLLDAMPNVVDTRHAVSTDVLVANPRFVEDLLPSERTVLWEGALAAMRAANSEVARRWESEETRMRARGRWWALERTQRTALAARVEESRRAVLSRIDLSLLHDVQAARPER